MAYTVEEGGSGDSATVTPDDPTSSVGDLGDFIDEIDDEFEMIFDYEDSDGFIHMDSATALQFTVAVLEGEVGGVAKTISLGLPTTSPGSAPLVLPGNTEGNVGDAIFEWNGSPGSLAELKSNFSKETTHTSLGRPDSDTLKADAVITLKPIGDTLVGFDPKRLILTGEWLITDTSSGGTPNDSLRISSVPEPALSAALLSLLTVAAGCSSRRRRR